METTQIQREMTEEPTESVRLPASDEELICANCGFWTTNDEAYAYHIKLCSIPA